MKTLPNPCKTKPARKKKGKLGRLIGVGILRQAAKRSNLIHEPFFVRQAPRSCEELRLRELGPRIVFTR